MHHARDVAAELIRLASSSEAADHLTHLRLEKLLYYVQGWSLAFRDRPMFRGQIQAWQHGPVAVDAWHAFKAFNQRLILDSDVEEVGGLPLPDRMFIAAVWEAKKHLSASALWQQTHDEQPWRDARGDLPPAAPSSREIPHEAMKRFFLAEASEKDPHFSAVQTAREEIRRGHSSTLENFRADLGAA